MSIPIEKIEPDAQKVVRRLTRNGFTAYFVGGCVRDLLLGRTPKDFDVATNATPQEIKGLFRNCRIIGRRFRLAHIFFGPKIIETSTFRANPTEVEPDIDESAPPDSAPPADLLIRHDNVFGTAEEDARRRDFTINGLFYDLDQEKVIDYVEGLPDLEKKTVRTIGDPQIRFREDPIRILRAIKFAARLGFDIADDSYQAILDHKGDIAKCAPPRVLEEIYRLLRGGAARRSVELLLSTGVLEILIPDLSARLREESDGRRRLFATLEGLDARVKAGLLPTNALLLNVLLAPFLVDVLYAPEPVGAARIDPFAAVEEHARPILEGMRASRRDSERARQILLAQRRLMPGKRRRNRPMSLVRRDWFDEALTVFELMNPRPEGEIADEITRWERLRHEGHHAPPHGEGAAQVEGEEPRRRRRRRRGGRRRRRAGEIPQPLAPREAPAAAEETPRVAQAGKPDDPDYGW